jgi:hypothetical protein
MFLMLLDSRLRGNDNGVWLILFFKVLNAFPCATLVTTQSEEKIMRYLRNFLAPCGRGLRGGGKLATETSLRFFSTGSPRFSPSPCPSPRKGEGTKRIPFINNLDAQQQY